MWFTDSDLPAEDLDQWWAAYLYSISQEMLQIFKSWKYYNTVTWRWAVLTITDYLLHFIFTLIFRKTYILYYPKKGRHYVVPILYLKDYRVENYEAPNAFRYLHFVSLR